MCTNKTNVWQKLPKHTKITLLHEEFDVDVDVSDTLDDQFEVEE